MITRKCFNENNVSYNIQQLCQGLKSIKVTQCTITWQCHSNVMTVIYCAVFHNAVKPILCNISQTVFHCSIIACNTLFYKDNLCSFIHRNKYIYTAVFHRLSHAKLKRQTVGFSSSWDWQASLDGRLYQLDDDKALKAKRFAAVNLLSKYEAITVAL